DADGDGLRAAVEMERALHGVEVAPAVHRELLGLRGRAGRARVVGRVRESERRAPRAVRQHLLAGEVVAGPELRAVPDAGAASAARAADAIEVEAFAFAVLVELVVALRVPAIDHGIRHALAPHVDAAAAQPLHAGGRRIQRRAVHAMRDAIVLPGDVVQALGHEARIDTGGF